MLKTIYVIICKDDLKCYVGQTKDLKGRLAQHKFDSKSVILPLYESIHRHGWNEFKVITLKQNLKSDQADYWERLYIDAFNSLVPNGYNIQSGGIFGHEHNEKTKLKMRESHLGKIFSEERKANISRSKKGCKSPNLGKTFSEHTKRKISESLKGHVLNDCTKRKISESLKGHKHTDEAKKRIGAARKDHRHTDEAKRKISESHLNRPYNYCTWCNFSTRNRAAFIRWHNDNCKTNPRNLQI